ncbi:hypothetical protein [Actinomadura sp. 3N508]|uniref:hypothetical protein n=1 Tax=Actinomadura sp. 3N508 TaxID=3375153 RepID=UPI0037B086E7
MGTTRVSAAAGTPYELDMRRQLNQARQDLAEAHTELAVLRDQATVQQHRHTELHVAYVELLTHARATAAAAALGELAPARYIAGHLEEIGLQPAPGAVPDQVVAEGLAVSVRLSGGDRG